MKLLYFYKLHLSGLERLYENIMLDYYILHYIINIFSAQLQIKNITKKIT